MGTRVEKTELTDGPALADDLPVVCALQLAELKRRAAQLLPGVAKLAKDRTPIEGGYRFEFIPSTEVLTTPVDRLNQINAIEDRLLIAERVIDLGVPAAFVQLLSATRGISDAQRAEQVQAEVRRINERTVPGRGLSLGSAFRGVH